MTTNDARPSAAPALALDTAREIFRLISGNKAIIDSAGSCLAITQSAEIYFHEAVSDLAQARPGSPPPPGYLAREFGPGSPLKGFRLIEPGPPSTPQLDAGLLHDLRDLLHSLQLAISMSDKRESPYAAHDLIPSIATQIETLLNAASPKMPFELGAALTDLAAALAPAIHAEGAQLRLELPPAPIEICAPRAVVMRLVQNLLLNAARHSRGEVVLTLHAARNTAEGPQLEVVDNGPGLPPDRAAWLMSTPGAAAPPAPRDGHGHGLAIIREAVISLGARLEQVAGPRHLLRLQLPATRPGTADLALDGKRIWLAEDNNLTAELTAARLRQAGADCQILQSGEALLEAASDADGEPDLLICDYYLGPQTGAELCRLLQGTGFAAPIAILTAETNPDAAALCRFSGASAVWLKPLAGATLVAQIATLVAVPPEPKIFDPEIAPELLEDAGLDATLTFMRRALQEARDITPLYINGEIMLLRAALHAAIGATAITGLAQINYKLKALHAKVASEMPIPNALQQLQSAIEFTSQAIAKIDPIERKAVSPDPKSL